MVLRRGEGFEAAFWIIFAAAGFALTFEFDRPIEIYKFGAAGWPRVVLALIFVAAIGQLWIQLRERTRQSSGHDRSRNESHRIATPGGRTPVSPRLVMIFALPVAYAGLLDYLGFYFLTPLFCAGYLYITGERRMKRVLGITLFINALLITVFVKIFYVGLPIGYISPFYDFSNWLLVTIR